MEGEGPLQAAAPCRRPPATADGAAWRERVKLRQAISAPSSSPGYGDVQPNGAAAVSAWQF